MVPRKHHPIFQVPTKDYFEGYLESQQLTKANAVPCSHDEDNFDEDAYYPESSFFAKIQPTQITLNLTPLTKAARTQNSKNETYARTLFYEGRPSFAGDTKWSPRTGRSPEYRDSVPSWGECCEPSLRSQ